MSAPRMIMLKSRTPVQSWLRGMTSHDVNRCMTGAGFICCVVVTCDSDADGLTIDYRESILTTIPASWMESS